MRYGRIYASEGITYSEKNISFGRQWERLGWMGRLQLQHDIKKFLKLGGTNKVKVTKPGHPCHRRFYSDGLKVADITTDSSLRIDGHGVERLHNEDCLTFYSMVNGNSMPDTEKAWYFFKYVSARHE